MKLYFQHSDGTMSLVSDGISADSIVSVALGDLKDRNPKYKSYYQRTWTDDNGWLWVDVGSWSEFYIGIPD